MTTGKFRTDRDGLWWRIRTLAYLHYKQVWSNLCIVGFIKHKNREVVVNRTRIDYIATNIDDGHETPGSAYQLLVRTECARCGGVKGHHVGFEGFDIPARTEVKIEMGVEVPPGAEVPGVRFNVSATGAASSEEWPDTIGTPPDDRS